MSHDKDMVVILLPLTHHSFKRVISETAVQEGPWADSTWPASQREGNSPVHTPTAASGPQKISN